MNQDSTYKSNKLEKNRSSQANLLIIGRRETIALPQLNVKSIVAKIDTGAKTSALHAENIEEFELNNHLMIRFEIYPYRRDNKNVVTAEAKLLEYRPVKSSNGQTENRPVIVTTAEIKGLQWQIELTLTNRDVMGYRMLLGRQAMRDRFLVNPGKSFLQSSRHPLKIEKENNS